MSATISGGFKVGGARGKTKKGAPLMTSSFSANRDKNFDQVQDTTTEGYAPETTAWLT